VVMASVTSHSSARDRPWAESLVEAAHYPPRAPTIHLVVQPDIPVLQEFSVPCFT
jgi:hypothetical protein